MSRRRYARRPAVSLHAARVTALAARDARHVLPPPVADVVDLADYLAEAGAVVGGGAALFAALALVAGSAARDVASRFPVGSSARVA